MHALPLDPALSSVGLRQRLKAAPRAIWVGAVSFEDRCTASLEFLRDHGLTLEHAVALEYPTVVRQDARDKDRRARNRATVATLCGTVCRQGWAPHQVDPYSFQGLLEIVSQAVQALDPQLIIFDVSCMTKIHTLAVAAAVAKVEKSYGWLIGYSIPENYGDLTGSSKAVGWRDVIVAPLAETAVLVNEARSRGIVIAGHEADRLIVALAELEPSGGLILIAESRRRPDLGYRCERNNRKAVRQLTKMRASDWKKKTLFIQDLQSIEDVIQDEIEAARRYSAPAILFPYGPKSMIFLAGLKLCLTYPEASWFVYPMPSSYDVDYSEGVEETLWLLPTSETPATSP